MQSSVYSPIFAHKSASGRTLFLQLGQYRSCHIRVPDLLDRLPAVVVEGKFHSFLKAVKDRNKALDIVAKLYDQGDEAVITQTAKSYAIWVLEPNAYIERAKQR